MSAIAESYAANEVVSGVEEEPSELEELAEKTQSIWAQLYDLTIGNLIKIVHIVREAIGSVVRDAFFFPLNWSVIANRQETKEQLEFEKMRSDGFWDPKAPLDREFWPDQAEIRKMFDSPRKQTFPIQLKDGKTVNITCRIIETKGIKKNEERCYNLVQIPGIYTTIYNNIETTYPYLAAYLNAEKGAESLPPARFIMISENDLDIKPATLDEAGLMILETLKSLREEFGDIDQLVAHSLGNIFLANALKQVEDSTVLPKHICLDRGPTSVWEISKKYFCGLGRLIYPLAKVGGWTSDIEQDLVDFCDKCKDRPSLLVTGTVEDHHFSGSANLCLGEKIKEIKDIDVLVFRFPHQSVHEEGNHNLRTDKFNPLHLVDESDFMRPSENLSEAIIRHSLPEKQEELEETA